MALSKDDLIRELVGSFDGRDEQQDILHLPGWNLSTWAVLMSHAELLELRDGELLLRRGDASSDLYFLVHGRLEVSVPQASSISMSPLISIGPGSVVGELAFFDDHGRSASVWSRGGSCLLRLRRQGFDEFKASQPLLACDLLFAIGRIVAERLRKTQGGGVSHAK